MNLDSDLQHISVDRYKLAAKVRRPQCGQGHNAPKADKPGISVNSKVWDCITTHS
jgi:hypothetical protein